AGCGVLTAGVAPLANVARHSLPRGACMDVTADDVVAFWREAGPDNWFGGGPAFDMRCRERFFDAHMTASRAELGHWEDNATRELAHMLLLYLIPRNIFGGSPNVYATDPMARSVATRPIGHSHDMEVEVALRTLFYRPFMHSE